MTNRVALVLCLDIAMLLLVCVLECLSLTGLEWHVWLGFALCPLVLVHVVMQWQWFITQLQRMMTPGSYRVRINAILNLALLVMMSAVLLSGLLTSRQVTTLVGESFGRVRIWSEIHSWLNFVVVVLVGLHLALNWNWMVAALRRRRPERPGMTATGRRRGVLPLPFRREAGRPALRSASDGGGGERSFCVAYPSVPSVIGRGLAVLLIASLTTGAVYFAMTAMMNLPNELERRQNERGVVVAAGERRQPTPQSRPISLPHGFKQFIVTTSVVALVVIIGRYVFRLRL